MSDYVPQEWHDSPFTDTPVSAARLGHIEAGVRDHIHVPDSWCDLSLTNGVPVSGSPTPMEWAVGNLVGEDLALDADVQHLNFLAAGLYAITVHLALFVSSDADGQVKLAFGGTAAEFGWVWPPSPMVMLRPTVHVGGWYFEQTITLDTAKWAAGNQLGVSALTDNWEAGTVSLDTTSLLHVRRVA